MLKISANEVALMCGGNIISGRGNILISNVCIDSRTATKGSMFVALRGEVTDGHKFIGNAVEAGAVAVLSEENVRIGGCTVIKVDNSLKALHSFAENYRRKFGVKVVGITGSVGKTTTKELVYSVISSYYPTLKSQGNYNSETGLPLSVFNLDDSYRMAVLEMGMDAPGEIAALTKIARPEIAVITNIGVMHIEHLGSRENILKAKLEIERGLKKDGIMILNGDDDLLWSVRGKLKHKTVYYSIHNTEAKFRAEDITFGDNISSFIYVCPLGKIRVNLNTVGEHNVLNAVAAITCGVYCGIPLEKCADALSSFKNADMRQNIYDFNGYRIIEDCYNAGPASMKAAFETLSLYKTRKVAVLSDMLELGDYSEQYHREIGKEVASKADLLISYGEMSEYICDEARQSGMPEERVIYCNNSDDAATELKKNAKPGDTILFKGSRGMYTEKVLNRFKEEIENE